MDFKKFFQHQPKDKYPQKRDYNGKTIFLIDKFPVSNKDRLQISIEKTNSRLMQGLCVDVQGKGNFLGKIYKGDKRVLLSFWQDAKEYDPMKFELQVLTRKKFIYIQNTWEQPHPIDGKKVGFVDGTEWLCGRCNGAAMYSEEIECGRRYFCNDGQQDDDFDDIIFTVKNLGPPTDLLPINQSN